MTVDDLRKLLDGRPGHLTVGVMDDEQGGTPGGFFTRTILPDEPFVSGEYLVIGAWSDIEILTNLCNRVVPPECPVRWRDYWSGEAYARGADTFDVFALPTKDMADRFMFEIGGTVHPDGGNRVILHSDMYDDIFTDPLEP